MRITCEQCGQQHEIFWLERKGGKRTVVYRCDRVELVNKDHEIKYCTRDIYWPGQDDPRNNAIMMSLATVCTLERRKELLGKQQLQLIMINDRSRKS